MDKIIEKGGNFVLPVKINNKGMHKEIVEFFEDSIEKDFDYDSNDKKYYYYFYDNMLSPIDSFKIALDSLKHKRRIYKIFDYKRK